MKLIERWLRDRIGLDPSLLGPAIVERTVRQRMKALGLERLHDYRHHLERGAEWHELVEAVVVPETWFFRDRQPFITLARLARTGEPPIHPSRPLRLLSVPCSSGEEPYSMAMALLDAGLPPVCVGIDAVDISARALTRARRAVYGLNSFRGGDLGFRERHFKSSKDGFALRSPARAVVHFSQGNLLDDRFLETSPPYDFIFCRNLLIYFDAAARTRALERLERLLDIHGLLFVGAAELPLVVSHGFASANLPMAFACHKPGPARTARTSQRSVVPAPSGHPLRVAGQPPPAPEPAAKRTGSRLTPATTRRAGPSAGDTLLLARALADAGQLREATAVCENYVRAHSSSAQAHYLLGLLADTQGLASAHESYRRALYLDPNHYEALVRMALLCEKRGEAARARTLSRRAERIAQPT